MTELTEELQERVDLIKHKLKFIEQKPAVACITQLEPLIFAGDELAQLISVAGGESSTLDANPDIIILMPEGYVIEQTIKEIFSLMQLPNFAELKAIKNNRLYISDSTKDVTINPEATVEQLENLAEIINPKQFIFGNEGEAWVKFSL
jgi:iron complex transport system substrate-binding protein